MEKYEVFISYRRSDSTERALLVKEMLVKKGYDPGSIFLDLHSIHEGDFPERIQNALRNSKAFILLVSSNSFPPEMDSKPSVVDYYFEEIKMALDLKMKFVPILYDNLKIGDISFPKEIKDRNVDLKSAINYYPEYKDAVEDRIYEFLHDKKNWKEHLIVPAAILTIYAVLTLLSGLGMYVYDNFFLSKETQVELVTKHVTSNNSSYYYQLPDEMVCYSAKDGDIVHLQFGEVPVAVISKINMDQAYKPSFWTAMAGLIHQVSKSKLKPHGGKAIIAYAVGAVVVVTGIGLGCVLERMAFPVHRSSPIVKSLDNKDFWQEIVRRKTISTKFQIKDFLKQE